MKKNLFIGISLLAAITLTTPGCGNKQAKVSTGAEAVVQAIEVDDVLNDADKLVGQTITIEGVCTHTCKHGGKKMFLMGSDESKTLRVDAGEAIGSFPQEVVNNIVDVTGTLKEERIDEATIQQMEEQYKQAQAEKHGDGEAGCVTEKNAHGQKALNSFEQRMQNYRDRIAERNEKEGKPYLSFYALEGNSYSIQE